MMLCNIFSMNKVTIRYCTGCKWLLRAAWMAQELLSTFEQELDELTLQPGNSGIFEVWANDQRIWSRADDGGFPEIKVLKSRLRDVIAQGRDLGHSDVNRA
jgi:selenoprotein W-related protein